MSQLPRCLLDGKHPAGRRLARGCAWLARGASWRFLLCGPLYPSPEYAGPVNMPQNAEHQRQAERRLRALAAQPRFRALVDKKLGAAVVRVRRVLGRPRPPIHQPPEPE